MGEARRTSATSSLLDGPAISEDKATRWGCCDELEKAMPYNGSANQLLDIVSALSSHGVSYCSTAGVPISPNQLSELSAKGWRETDSLGIASLQPVMATRIARRLGKHSTGIVVTVFVSCLLSCSPTSKRKVRLPTSHAISTRETSAHVIVFQSERRASMSRSSSSRAMA